MLSLENVSKKFKDNVFIDFSYDFEEKNIYKISGKNGSGKTTLLKLIKGLYIEDSGNIIFSNNLLPRHISYVNDNYLSFIQRLTVIQNLEYFHSIQNTNIKTSYIDDLLVYFGVKNLKHEIFSNLSQGQMQLISLIRSMSIKPKIILIDEGFSAIDEEKMTLLESFLIDYVESGNILIFSSHDESVLGKINKTYIRL